MSVGNYQELHEKWHKKLNKAVDHIVKAREIVSEIPPSILSAITMWGEKGVQTSEGEVIMLDIVGHASFRERCLLVNRILEDIMRELTQDLTI